jgi:PhnB protein
MTNVEDKTHFAPELHIPNGITDIDFYKKFGATEIFCLRNDDGTIHVAELEINGAIFHVHETMRDALEPISAKGVTSVIGLFVPDVEELMQKLFWREQQKLVLQQTTNMVTDKECSKTLLDTIGRSRKKFNGSS